MACNKDNASASLSHFVTVILMTWLFRGLPYIWKPILPILPVAKARYKMMLFPRASIIRTCSKLGTETRSTSRIIISLQPDACLSHRAIVVASASASGSRKVSISPRQSSQGLTLAHLSSNGGGGGSKLPDLLTLDCKLGNWGEVVNLVYTSKLVDLQ